MNSMFTNPGPVTPGYSPTTWPIGWNPGYNALPQRGSQFGGYPTQQQQRLQGTNLIKVIGPESAKSTLLGPNASYVMFHSSEPIFYLVESDDSGYSTMETYRYWKDEDQPEPKKEAEAEPQPDPRDEEIKGLTEQVDSLKSDISDLKDMMSTLKGMVSKHAESNIR